LVIATLPHSFIACSRRSNAFQKSLSPKSVSVSPTAVSAVKSYIQNQKTHHQKRNSRAEFIVMLRQAGIVVGDDVE
jgi:hypothetical protein